MSNNALHDILDSLHKQLASLPALTPQNIDDLKAIVTEIQSTLEKQSPTTDNSPTLSSRLNLLVEDFEKNHPQLTQTLSTLAERLADMGI
jgi:ABC-type transporter Mla subunit MlaD